MGPARRIGFLNSFISVQDLLIAFPIGNLGFEYLTGMFLEWLLR